MTATATAPSATINVPLLDLKAQYGPLKKDIMAAIERVVESQYFIMGPDVAELETVIASYVGAKHAIGCASGSDAIMLALAALGIGKDDEVICPSFTFFATGGYTTKVGAIPVYADLDPVTYNMDPEHVRKLAKKCKRKDSAKKEAQLDAIARCMAGASTIYKNLADADAIAEMDLAELPREFRKHKRKVAKLVKRGAKLVRYHVNDGNYYIFVIFVLDPETDYQTANVVLESVEFED